jgi:osmotically-inducible protein OsmY
MKNTDAKIQLDVIQELKWDPSVTPGHIGVSAADGIVTLSGTVPSYVGTSCAERVAQRVTGVKAVVESIEVKPPGTLPHDNQDIAKAILDQFRWHTEIPDGLIKATVEKGRVELTGEVDWDYQRRAAENAVRGLMGVKVIINKILIKPRVVQRSIIKDSIERALKEAAEREANRVAVEVDGGRVILSGKVRSFAELCDVRGAAWGAPGVTAVDYRNLKIAA